MVTIMNEDLSIAPHVVEACVNHISGSAKAGVAGVYNKALYLSLGRYFGPLQKPTKYMNYFSLR